jgi:hypothetical protein
MAINPRIAPIEKATSRRWAEWLKFLDQMGAKDLDHTSIAVKVSQELEGQIDNPGWWAQGITVVYEQEIGRRLPGQRSDGSFEINASRSTGLGMQELMDRWTEFAAGEAEIQELIAGEPRLGGTEKRRHWRAKSKDGASLQITAEPKSDGTAAIIATIGNLPSPEASAAAKEQWSQLLSRAISTFK